MASQPPPVPTPEPTPTARQPIVDTGVARRAVKAALAVLARDLGKATADEKTFALRAAMRELHLDIAGAEFDAALPTPPRGRELVGSTVKIEQPGGGEEPLP